MPAPTLSRATRLAGVVATFALALALYGCAKHATPHAGSLTWYAGRAQPAFDPDGPADALRIALERHLSRGLFERGVDGGIAPALVDSFTCSEDSLTWTFRLREGLRFTDHSPVTSAHVRDALIAGLGREDHATRAWLLGAVRGVPSVRVGRPLPALGITTPDARTIEIALTTPDRRLPEKLAVPGVSTPWKSRSGGWNSAVGVGPYRLVTVGPHELVLVAAPLARARAAATLDTLRVRFEVGVPRARAMLRRDLADVMWPLPPKLLERPLPEEWNVSRHIARPERRLLLVMRADVPPLTQASAREGLAHALNREELLAALGTRGTPLRRWFAGATSDFEWPRLETMAERAERRANEARDGGLRGATAARREPAEPERVESWHLVLACDADLSGAEVADEISGQWERAGHYVDLRALHGAAAAQEALRATAAQAQLVEAQAPIPGPEAELAMLVMPLRGPAVGSFRTGWRTRAFDRFLGATGRGPEPDPDQVQSQLASTRIVLPIALLPWQWAVRKGVPEPTVHPAYGLDWTRPVGAGADLRTR